MTNREVRQLLLLIVVSLAFGVGVWALLRFTPLRRLANSSAEPSNAADTRSADPDLWARSMEKVKEDRGESGNVALEIPTQLRHYEDRHWFLATQVAEVKKFNVQPVQDFVDLAVMLRRGEMVSVPAVTDTYILFGVGAKADNGAFTRWMDDHNIELYDDAELRNAYARLESAHSNLQKDISGLQKQLATLKKGSSARELQKEIAARQQELKSNDEGKAVLDQSYGSSESRQRLLGDYASLQTLARNFGGRSFDLDNSNDRQAFKVNLLSSLRPQALKMLEEVAQAYHDKFDRPLPVSSLVRPEQYQHVLRRFNRAAVLIDTPPHSTGLAFDIDYRYMNGAEQNFLMNELARLKDAGRIEVLRERNANYHVFAFLDGARPSDDLITASLQEAGAPENEPTPAGNPTGRKPPEKKTPAKVASKSRTPNRTKTTAKPKSGASKPKRRKRH
ncbi:MAG TPA: DUF5715 family protein [Pyrinomonadaceae bacterium]|nr:DUF5715 family protein [Pyrinomonadaceae bacterium]